MITLDDCIEFCGMPPAVVTKIAGQQSLPMVMACAYVYGRTVSANDDRLPEPFAPKQSRLVA